MTEDEAAEVGLRAVDSILGSVFGVDVSKALDPTDPKDFVTIVTRLSRALSRATESTEVEILRRAVDNLDVDWPAMSEAARGKLIDAVAAAIAPDPERLLPAVEQTISVTGTRVMRQTRRATRALVTATLRARIGTSLTLQDQRILDHLVSSQALFVRDEYGRRRSEFSRVAREVVRDGVDQGLGRDAITTDLVTRFGPEAGIARSRAYWNVIASTYASRARGWAHLASFEEAGIERYVFEAVLDERTTDQCALLHGRVFEVSRAQALYREVDESGDPESVKDTMPWIRVGTADDGTRILFTENRAGDRTRVAEVVQSRVGTRDNVGEFRNARSTSDLAEMGLCMPPLHANCRSTIVPDES